jgi:PleD family two-component response regulator
MPTKGSIGDARERSREVGRNDGLGADPTRAAAATRRDEAAEERDTDANARDGLATAADSDRGSPSRWPDLGRQDERSARDREAAASDRVEAGLDRAQAASDRELATDGIANEVCDHLTGAMGPRFGLAALRREILRTERSDELLLVAFVEAVGREVAGQRPGQVTNDRIMRDVAECLSDDLRDYDLIARVADSGFVCAQSGQSLSRAAVRYRDIALRLSQRPDGTQMKVGLVAREAGDTFEALLQRADGSLLDAVA